MKIQIELDDLPEELVDTIAQRIQYQLQDWVHQEVSEAFDYHEDKFRMSWMRMAESEMADLCAYTRDNACNHGQKIYDGLFHAIDEYFRVMKEEAKEEVPTSSTYLRAEEEESSVVYCGDPSCATCQRAEVVPEEVRQINPDLERILAEEEEIERRTRVQYF